MYISSSLYLISYFDIIFSQDLYDPNPLIIDFYPLDFELDLNGKQQDWEAIVKTPTKIGFSKRWLVRADTLYIEMASLRSVFAAREHLLMAAEKQRNSFGMGTQFSYNPEEPILSPPPLYRCTSICPPSMVYI
jgi:5'-3' exoribonuclease 1